MSYQVLARKWRPSNFSEVIGQTHAVQALSNALTQKYLHHAYLFTGTRGVGKTTIARILAKCLNCEQDITPTPCNQCSTCQEINTGRFTDLLEIDAASRTKVEDIRELLDNVQYAPTKGRFKIYLIDEVHMLSGHSFNALLKTLEEPPAHVKFLLATTDPQRLPATVLSRCLQFHLLQMSAEQINQHLQEILKKEKIDYEPEATLLLSKAADGSMRDALSLLDQSIAYGNGHILLPEVKTMLGTTDNDILYKILIAISQQDVNKLLESITQLNQCGADFSSALAGILSLLHQITIIQVAPDIYQEVPDETLQALAHNISREDVQLFYQIGLLGQRDIQLAPTPRVGFEMTLLRMLTFNPNLPSKKIQKSSTNQTITEEPALVSAAHIDKDTLTIETIQTDSPTITWKTMIEQLKLSGAARILAEHCLLKEIKNDTLYLILHPDQKAFLHNTLIERISEAASKFFGKKIQATLEIKEHELETPINLTNRQRKKQLEHAEQAITSDHLVKRMVHTFDATIIKESITTND